MLVCCLCSNKSNEIMHRIVLLTVIEYMCASFTSDCNPGLILVLSLSHGLWLLASTLENAHFACQHFLKQKLNDLKYLLLMTLFSVGVGVSSTCNSMYDGLCGAICIIWRVFECWNLWTGNLEIAAQKRIPPEPRSQCVTRGWDPIVSFWVESKSIFCYTRA